MLASLLMLLGLPLSAQTQSNETRSNETQSNPVEPKLANRSESYAVDIGSVPRVQALHELSTQTGLLLGYLSTDAAEEQAIVGPVKGVYTIEAVLRELLRASVLTFRWVEPHIISVEPIRLAGGGPLSSLPHSSEVIAGDIGPPEEIIVTAWPLRDLTFLAAPARVIDRERIDAIGAPSLAEALRYISQSAYTRPDGYRTSGSQYAELRGLGPETALILINGRRVLPSANSLTSSAFDLNTVPITAVERIELLLDSSSAVYGTDAIGGVINIVLKDKVAKPTVDVRYGTAEGGAEQERATLSFGKDSDRLNVAVVADYLSIGGLLGADRDRWRNQDFRRFGSVDRRSLYGTPGNISSALPGNLPGLSSPFAAVPLTDPTPGVSRDDFVATAGQRNLDSMFRHWSLVPEAKRFSAFTTASWEFNDRFGVSAEALYVDRTADFQFSPAFLPGLPVMPGNAFNPFGIPVIANLTLPGFAPQGQHVESDLTRTVLALHGAWGTWDGEVSWLHSSEKAQTWISNAIDMQQAMVALSSSDPDWALNPFQNNAVITPQLRDRLLAPRHVDELSSSGTQFAGYLQGPLLYLPAGPLSTTIGGERREELAQFNTAQGELDRNVEAAFTHVRIPLVNIRMNVWGMRELWLTAGARWDRYSDISEVLLPQYGAIWKPHRNFTVRASVGESFRPPSLYELYLPRISVPIRVSDPARGNRPADIFITGGGNSELKAATADSVTAGITFAPLDARNLKISVDYWRIAMERRPASVPAALLLANEAQFPDRVLRAAPTPADVAAGLPGALLSVDTSRINAGKVTASGVDFSIRSDLNIGNSTVTPELLVTWFDKFLSIDIPGTPAVERVGLASELGTITEWRAIFSLRWQRGPFTAETFARFTPPYDDAVAGVRTGREVASQTLFDMQGALDLSLLPGASPLWQGFKLTAGAFNVFNQEPRFAEVGDGAGFDQSQGDLKQRSYYLRLEKKF